MAYDASPPIKSKYTRQAAFDSRPRTPGASRITDDLDESSLAAWWNIDKTINLNNNTTPFRKQRYEPIKWANAHLLLDEDGAEFLADDPFATPAPVLKSTKKLSSARKRNSNAAAGYPRSSGRASAGSHRDLTLADLTPRSRRLSGFRTKTPLRSGTSEPNVRPLRLSFNGAAFAPNLHHDLEVIQEHNSRQLISPLLPAFGPLTPERFPASQLSPATPQRTHQGQSKASPTKTVASIRTPTRQPRPSETRSAAEGTKQKRKSGRPSIPSAGALQPTQSTTRSESDGDDEELHKSIPGAFDFVPSKRFEPAPPKTVPREPKLPRRSNTTDGIKPRSSTRPSEPTMKRAITIPETSNSGLAGILVEYGNSLMGLLGPNPDQPPATQVTTSLKLSDLSPQKAAATRQPNGNESTKTGSKVNAPKATAPRKPAVPSPAKTKPVSRAPTVVPPSRLQKPSQSRLGSKAAATRSTDNTVQLASVATKVTDRTTTQPTRCQVVGRASPRHSNASPMPRSRSHSRPPSAVHEGQSTHVSEPTANAVSRTISTETVSVVRQPRASAGTSNIVMRTSPLPSPQKMLVDSSPVTRASPVKPRPSTSRVMAIEPAPVVANAPKPSYRALKPILKKRSLETSPAKAGLEERAKKRQKIAEVSTVAERGREKDLSVALERGMTAGERGRTAMSRRGKIEQAPRKQVARSRSRVNAEVPALVLPDVGAGPSSIRRHRSRSQDAGDRSRSRLGQRIMDSQDDVMMYTAAHGPSEGLEEDVFGTVMENSLEVVNAATATPRCIPPPQHILESMSPVQRPQPPLEHRRTANNNRPASLTSHVLQPSTTYNSPKRTRAPVAITQKAASPARIDYRPQLVEHFPEDSFVPQPQDHERDMGCRLTIPVSPKFMRAHREKEREERWVEQERPMKHLVQYKERSTRPRQREMPPVAAALLAKLAGFEADLTNHRTRDKSAPTTTHKFTFRSDLRPTLGRDGAVLADRAIKQQFESTRNLWEQRSLEASQESQAESLHRSRSRSRGASAHRARPVGRYALPTASTTARVVEREARRDVRRRQGEVQREERGKRMERVAVWNRPSGARENLPW